MKSGKLVRFLTNIGVSFWAENEHSEGRVGRGGAGIALGWGVGHASIEGRGTVFGRALTVVLERVGFKNSVGGGEKGVKNCFGFLEVMGARLEDRAVAASLRDAGGGEAAARWAWDATSQRGMGGCGGVDVGEDAVRAVVEEARHAAVSFPVTEYLCRTGQE